MTTDHYRPNAADRAHRAAFLARGFRVGQRCHVEPWGNGTIMRVGGNCAFVTFDADAQADDAAWRAKNPGPCDVQPPHSQRVILFESINEAPA